MTDSVRRVDEAADTTTLLDAARGFATADVLPPEKAADPLRHVDTGGPLNVSQEISMPRTFLAEAFGRDVDRPLQALDGSGMVDDQPIAQWYADARPRRRFRHTGAGAPTRAACGAPGR